LLFIVTKGNKLILNFEDFLGALEEDAFEEIPVEIEGICNLKRLLLLCPHYHNINIK
jgi:hypothetical protein